MTFRVWAPHATSVTVPGQFNGWSTTATPLVQEGTNGVWSADVTTAVVGQEYKYFISGPMNTYWKRDPRNRKEVSSAGNSIIYDPNAFNWAGDNFTPPPLNDLVIYELHIGTFSDPNPADSVPGKFTDAITKLDYLKQLGINAVEVMPIAEFPGDFGWGYSPSDPFAVENSGCGGPDGFKTFVKACHDQGIAVLLDIVHNHYNNDDLDLWWFDGWYQTLGGTNYGGIYFYSDPNLARTEWGPRPNYSEPQVRSYIKDNFQMWLDEYHVDGFRWDSVTTMYTASNGQFIAEGWTLIQEVSAMIRNNYPNKIDIAEGSKGGFSFDTGWDTGFQWGIMSQLTQGLDENRDMDTVANDVDGYGDGLRRVVYIESHDVAGHDGGRIVSRIDGSDPASYWARKRSTLGAALTFTSPGVPMLFQGQEMLEGTFFSLDGTNAVDWVKTNTYANIVLLYRDLIALRRDLFGVTGGLNGELVDVFHEDNTNKLVAYRRWSGGTTNDDVIVVANFANATRSNHALQFPRTGTWYVHFNSDSTYYGSDYGNVGSSVVTAGGTPPTGTITIAPYSVLILSQTPRSVIINSSSFTDVVAGNGDGVLDPGELIQEQIVLRNAGNTSASNITATLLSGSPGVTIVQATSAYPDLPAGSGSTNSTLFQYRLAKTVPCGTTISLTQIVACANAVFTNTLTRLVGQSQFTDAHTNTFEFSDVPKAILDLNTIYSVNTITTTGFIAQVTAAVRLDHTWDGDLGIGLQHPDGTEVILSNHRGYSGHNFGTGTCGAGEVRTVFDDDAAAPIAYGAAPFAGSYKPGGSLSSLVGKPMDGMWRLRISDRGPGDTGTLYCCSVHIIYRDQVYACSVYNNPPTCTNLTVTVAVGASAEVLLAGSDVDGDVLSFVTNSLPTQGTISSFNPITGLITYTPVPSYFGPDSFSYLVNDGTTNSSVATVSINVLAPDSVGDGIPDSWRQQYFGGNGASTNSLSCATCDAGGTGQNNLFKYVAGLDPTNPASIFVLRIAGVTNQPVQQNLAFNPKAAGRTYTPEFRSNLTLGSWLPLTSYVGPATNGSQVTITDTNGVEPQKFYRLRISWP